MSEECSQWLDRWSVQLKTKEPGSHAQVVERHHELFRQIYHRTKTQLKEEKIVLDKEILVAECFLVKNLMISVAGSSPYQAVYGRVPPLMAEFEPASETQLDDTSGGVSGMSRHHHRLREVSVQSMVEMTARQRMDRALTSKTRQSHQQLTLEVNDTVDFH